MKLLYQISKKIKYKYHTHEITFDLLKNKFYTENNSLIEINDITNENKIRKEEFLNFLEYKFNNSESLFIDFIPTYKCNLCCEYCYSNQFRATNTDKIISTHDIFEFIKSYFNKNKYKNLFLGLIGGGEPLIELNNNVVLLSSMTNFFSNENIKLRIVTNGTYLIDAIKEITSILDNNYKIEIQITINYLNIHSMAKILKLLDCFKNKYNKNLKIVLLIYVYNQFSDKYLKIMNYVKQYKVILKPVNMNNKLFNLSLFFETLKFFHEHEINFDFNDHFIPCTNKHNKNYMAIDLYGNIYKCHAQSNHNDFIIGNVRNNFRLTTTKLINNLNNDCIECDFFPKCIGGCYPLISNNSLKVKKCTYYNYYKKIYEYYIQKFGGL